MFVECVDYLFKVVELMRKRKYEFFVMFVYEVGKNWVEVDVDIVEVIDFMEFYVWEMICLSEMNEYWFLMLVEGEIIEMMYIFLGVGVVILFFNFLFVIMVGMIVVGIVSGNVVILKLVDFVLVIVVKFV